MLEQFFENKLKWKMNRKIDNTIYLNDILLRRYGSIYESWVNFVKDYESICHVRDDAWLYTDNIYKPSNGIAYAWNFAESFELESCLEDNDRIEISKKWDDLLPIALCVSGEYVYWAISKNGNFVSGCIIDGAECSIVGDSFSDFIQHITKYVD